MKTVGDVVSHAMSKKPKEKTINLGEKGKMHIKAGAMTAAAKREGVSNSKYEQEHKGDNDLAGKRARLAITMKGWNHGGK